MSNLDSRLTADDAAQLEAIQEAVSDPAQFAAKLFDYYHDNDRADRTSRAQMYLHLGMAVGIITRLAEQ